jgi:hypothetical protein
MRLISHRGNIDGRISELENLPTYVDNAINLGYEVEVDAWVIEKKIYLGHDGPNHEIDLEWLAKRSQNLWIHCKNTEAMSFLNSLESDLNYFWHQEDVLSLTSKKYIWVYPGKQPIENSIAVMPEIENDDISLCLGICSDYILKYKK